MREEFKNFEKEINKMDNILKPISIGQNLGKVKYKEIIDYIKKCDSKYLICIILLDERFQTIEAFRDIRILFECGYIKKKIFLAIAELLTIQIKELQNKGFLLNFKEVNDDIIEELRDSFKDSREEIYIFLDENEQTDELFAHSINENNMISIWKNTKKQTNSKLSILLDYLNGTLNSPDKYLLEIWECTYEKSESVLSMIMNSDAYKSSMQSKEIESAFINALFIRTSSKNTVIIDILLDKFFEKSSKVYTLDQTKKMKQKMHTLISLSRFANENIDLRILSEEYDFFNINQLLILCSDIKLQIRIVDFFQYSGIDNILLKKIFSRLCENNLNWKRNLSRFLHRRDFDYFSNEDEFCYKALLNQMSKYQNQQELDRIIDIFISIKLRDPMNYFEIDSIEKLFNYEQIKRETCIRLINEEEVDVFDIFSSIGKIYIRKKDRKKFAILELKYGICLDEAENLVKKYGKDIQFLSLENTEESNAVETIIDIAKILELGSKSIDTNINIQQFGDTNILDISKLEDILRNMYGRTFQNQINSSSPPIKQQVIKYDGNRLDLQGKELTVEDYSPIDENGDFKYTETAALVRKEGGFVSWIEPDNYVDYYNSGSLYKRKFFKLYNTKSNSNIGWQKWTNC